MDAITRVMNRIESQISGHELLSKMKDASAEEIGRLVKQYGEEPVIIGRQILDAYACLNEIVSRLNDDY